MKLKSLFTFLACAVLLCSCGGSKSKLAEIADAYVQIGANQGKYAEGYRALYEMPKEEQESALNKLNSEAEAWNAENKTLAEKAERLAAELVDTEFPCTAAENTGISVKSAKFTAANAPVGKNYNGMGGCVANFIITVDYEGMLTGKPYFSLLAGEEVAYRSIGSTNGNGQITVSFRINLKNAQQFTSVDALRIEASGEGNMSEAANEQSEPEPTYLGNDGKNSVQNANVGGNEIKVGANLADALRSATNVTYEYNADSGIWASIGNVAIVIDEDQLNQKGIDFLSTIYSDIAPDIAFKPEYVKPDAKINQIEKL